MDETPDYYDREESAYPAQQPQQQHSTPQTVYDPAGYSVKQPSAEKRNATLRSVQAGEQQYQNYREIKTHRSRYVLTIRIIA